MSHDPYVALYIHIPFCVSKCSYCDFHSFAYPEITEGVREYVEDLILQIKHKSHEGELSALKTIYIGGGTPTHLGNALLTQLLYGISMYVNLENIEEFTIEANPESLNESMVKDIWALGVNRLSLGVQSFDNEVLKLIRRPHSSKQAEEAIKVAKERFDNIGIDLICGLPGQTREGFTKDVEHALDLGVKHISIYPLSVERGTPIFKEVRKGVITLPDDDEVADMLEDAESVLVGKGFARYEVASYCLPGFESKHNTTYWSGLPYLGLGESATTMTQNNVRRMRVTDGEVVDDLDPRQMAAEDLMLAMRMTRGTSDELIEKVSLCLDGVHERLIDLESKQLIVHEEDAWRPTKLGWLCGNELYGALLDLAP